MEKGVRCDREHPFDSVSFRITTAVGRGVDSEKEGTIGGDLCLVEGLAQGGSFFWKTNEDPRTRSNLV